MDWEDVWDFLRMLGMILLLIGIVVGLLIGTVAGCGALTQSNACRHLQALNPEMAFDYDFWTGCRVQMPQGQWVPVDDMRYYFADVHIVE